MDSIKSNNMLSENTKLQAHNQVRRNDCGLPGAMQRQKFNSYLPSNKPHPNLRVSLPEAEVRYPSIPGSLSHFRQNENNESNGSNNLRDRIKRGNEYSERKNSASVYQYSSSNHMQPQNISRSQMYQMPKISSEEAQPQQVQGKPQMPNNQPRMLNQGYHQFQGNILQLTPIPQQHFQATIGQPAILQPMPQFVKYQGFIQQPQIAPVQNVIQPSPGMVTSQMLNPEGTVHNPQIISIPSVGVQPPIIQGQYIIPQIGGYQILNPNFAIQQPQIFAAQPQYLSPNSVQIAQGQVIQAPGTAVFVPSNTVPSSQSQLFINQGPQQSQFIPHQAFYGQTPSSYMYVLPQQQVNMNNNKPADS